MLRRRAKVIAWISSVGIHAALGWLLLTDDAGQLRNLPPAEAVTRDTVAGDDFAFEMSVERTVEPTAAKSIQISLPTGQRPVELIRPSAISPEMKNLVRDLAARPAARVEVQDIAPIDFREPVSEPKTGTVEAIAIPTAVAKPGFGKGQPLHGKLPVGKSVVYIVDRSTSMGLTRETFDAARAALLASVEALPADSRFQVIAYNGRATRLFPGDLLKKSDEHTEKLTGALRALTPEGNSNHTAALRAALALGGDYLVLISDAADAELDELRPILKAQGRGVLLSIVRAEAGKVSEATALR